MRRLVSLTDCYPACQIIITTAHCQCKQSHFTKLRTPYTDSLTFAMAFSILTPRGLGGVGRKVHSIARVAQWKRNRLVIGRLVGSTPLSGFDFRLWRGGG